MMKQLISILLIVMMMFSLLAMTVIAEDDEADYEDEDIEAYDEDEEDLEEIEEDEEELAEEEEEEFAEEALDLLQEADEELSEFEYQDNDLFKYAIEYYETAESAYDEGDYETAFEYAEKTLAKLETIEDQEEDYSEKEEYEKEYDEEQEEDAKELVDEAEEEYEDAKEEYSDHELFKYATEYLEKAQAALEKGDYPTAIKWSEETLDKLDYIEDQYEEYYEFGDISFEEYEEVLNLVETELSEAEEDLSEASSEVCDLEEAQVLLDEAYELKDKAMSKAAADNTMDAIEYLDDSLDTIDEVYEYIFCDDEEYAVEEDDEEYNEDILALLANLQGEAACNGCEVDGRCIETGVRFESEGLSLYCSFDGTVAAQLAVGESCQNDFECSTNSCQSGVCYDLKEQIEETQGLMKQIIGWFGNIFGRT